MSSKTLTEYEWRKRQKYGINRPSWWGAQCIYSLPGFSRKTGIKSVRRCLFAVSFLISLFIFWENDLTERESIFVDIPFQEINEKTSVRPEVFQRGFGAQVIFEKRIFTSEELTNGKLLVLEGGQTLPAKITAPNTFSIARFAEGCVPVTDENIKTGKETIEALQKLFIQLEDKGVQDLYVDAGIMSEEQQRKDRLDVCRQLMKNYPASEAFRKALSQTEEPGTGELLQPYAIEIRLKDHNGLVCEKPLDATEQGSVLLDLAWRYGFVPAGKEHPYRFRYVGKVHATAMTYLNLDFRSYLSWMHEQRQIIINEGGKPAYLVMCMPYEGGDALFELPEFQNCEASIDNLGYALVACIL